MESEEQKQDGVSLSYIDILIFIIANKGNIHYNNSVYCYSMDLVRVLCWLPVLLDLSSSTVFQLDLVVVVSSYPFLLLLRIQVNAKKTWF